MVHKGSAAFCKLNVGMLKVEVTTWINTVPITISPSTYGGMFYVQNAGEITMSSITALDIYATDTSSTPGRGRFLYANQLTTLLFTLTQSTITCSSTLYDESVMPANFAGGIYT